MKQQTWISTLGLVKFENNELHYEPEPGHAPAPGQAAPAPVAITKSNISFEDGRVSFDVWLSAQQSICQLILGMDTPEWTIVGFNTSGAPYGIQRYKDNKFDILSAAGTVPDFPLQQWIPVVVDVSGSALTLTVRGVPLCLVSNAEVTRSPLAFLFQGEIPIKVRNVHVTEAPPKVFVVMQFVPQFNELFEEVIRPTCESFGYSVVRADDIYTNGQIVADIVENIKEASVVIADVTPDNPNVYYEVGFAHALAKPTILLCDKRRERLPFDLSGFRTVFYENSIGGKSSVEDRLRKHLEAIRKPVHGPPPIGRLNQG
jgi:hypothetical protein